MVLNNIGWRWQFKKKKKKRPNCFSIWKYLTLPGNSRDAASGDQVTPEIKRFHYHVGAHLIFAQQHICDAWREEYFQAEKLISHPSALRAIERAPFFALYIMKGCAHLGCRTSSEAKQHTLPLSSSYFLITALFFPPSSFDGIRSDHFFHKIDPQPGILPKNRFLGRAGR